MMRRDSAGYPHDYFPHRQVPPVGNHLGRTEPSLSYDSDSGLQYLPRYFHPRRDRGKFIDRFQNNSPRKLQTALDESMNDADRVCAACGSPRK